MDAFKLIFRIVFGLAIVLGAFWIINFLFIKGRPFGGMLLFYVNLLQVLILVIFIFVVLYNRLFRKIPFAFLKTEWIYLLIQIFVWVLFSLSSKACPTCPGSG